MRAAAIEMTPFAWWLENPKNRTIYSDGTTPAVTYTYNTAGQLATAANGTDTLTWTYDLAGQLLSEQSAKNASLVEYTYDPAGNRLSVKLDGTLFVSYAYDDASRLTTITRGSNVFGFGYDNSNRRTSMTYPNGVNTSYSYDTLNRLLNLSAVHTPTSSTITNFNYTYDAAGNRLTKQQPDYTETYGYDPLYRLTQAERTGSLTGLQTWSYDPVGNRLTNQKDGAVTTSSYNEKNQLTSSTGGGLMLWRGSLDEPGTVSFTSALVNGKPARMLPGNVFEALLPMNSGSNTVTLAARDTTGNVATKQYSVNVTGDGATLTYDLNGNLATKVDGVDAWVYAWDAENRLKSVEKNGTQVALFAYDSLGRRVEKQEAGATKNYTYEAESVLREAANGGAPLMYLHGPFVDESLAGDLDSSLATYHTDGLGSIVGRTNASGGVTLSFRYDAFGVLESGNPISVGFTGRELDPVTGLIYARARYLDPKSGRFLSEDPVAFHGGDLNYFTYVWNNPVAFTDPSGLAGVGLQLGGDVDIGNGAIGAGAQGAAGVMYCKKGFNPLRGWSLGAFAQGGFHVGTPLGRGLPGIGWHPSRSPIPISFGLILGKFIGGGLSIVGTNATCPCQLAGPFNTLSVNSSALSLQLQWEHGLLKGIKTFSVSPPRWSLGTGFSISLYKTTTGVNATGLDPSCSCVQ